MRRAIALMLVGFTALCVACSSGDEVRKPAEISNIPDADLLTVQVRATDYNFELAHQVFRTGLTQFEVVNIGSMPHELMVVPFDGERLGLPLAHVELPEGARQYVRMDLPPGKYQFVCVLQVRTGNGLASHLSLGMAKVVEVEG